MIRPWLRSRTERVVLGAALGVQILVAWAFARRAYFNGDDLINAALARELGFGWDFLNRSIFGHWAPGHRTMDWIVTETASLNWSLALAISIFWIALALVFVDRLLVALDTDDRVRWALLLVVALSPLVLNPVTWFATGMHMLPGLALVTMSLDGFCRYRITRSPLALFECAFGFGAGLLFYEIPLLLVGTLPLLAIVLLPGRLGLRAVGRELVRLWPVAAALGPIALAYFWHYETNVAYGLAHPTAAVFADFMWESWSRGFVASAAGVAASPGSWFGQTPGVVLGQVAAVTIVAVTIARRSVAWRGWALVAVVFLVNAALVGWGRAGEFSAAIGADARYHTAVLPFVVIAIALAFPRGSPLRWSPVMAVGAGAALVVYVTVALGSAAFIVDHSPGIPIRPWIANVRNDLARLERDGTTVSLYDTTVPPWVMPIVLDPHNRAVHVVPQIDDRAVVDPVVTPRYAIGRDGHVRPARFETLGTATLLDQSGARTAGPVCISATEPVREMRAVAPANVGAGRRFLRVRLDPGPRTGLRVYALEPTGPREATDLRSVVVPAGKDSIIVGVNVTDLTDLQVSVDAGTDACIAGIDVGVPRPERDARSDRN